MKRRLGKKLFGIGVKGAAFLGGAGFGLAAGLLSYSILHRYFYIRNLMFVQGVRTWNWNQNYYEQFYLSNTCFGGCPNNSHCEWSYCECDVGFHKFRGSCKKEVSAAMMQYAYAIKKDKSGNICKTNDDCTDYDINLICKENLTTNKSTCGCRENMAFNPQAQECQIFMDIDCGQFSFDDKVSDVVKAAADSAQFKTVTKSFNISEGVLKLEALVNAGNFEDALKSPMYTHKTEVEKALDAGREFVNLTVVEHLPAKNKNSTSDFNRTLTVEESLKSSMLPHLPTTNATVKNYEEAFCRDIESFNSLFITDDEDRDEKCPEVDSSACAVMYDSKDCSGGWNLTLPDGTQRNFYYWSSDWKYRNDVDTIGVRFGCTFTGFTSTGFSGNKMIISTGSTDRWVTLEKDAAYKSFDEDIESVQCFCKQNWG